MWLLGPEGGEGEHNCWNHGDRSACVRVTIGKDAPGRRESSCRHSCYLDLWGQGSPKPFLKTFPLSKSGPHQIISLFINLKSADQGLQGHLRNPCRAARSSAFDWTTGKRRVHAFQHDRNGLLKRSWNYEIMYWWNKLGYIHTMQYLQCLKMVTRK